MHASIPSTHVSSISLGFLYFSLFFFVYSVFFSFFLSLCFMFAVIPLFHYSRLQPFILPAMLGFTILTPQPLLARCGCPSKTDHWLIGYPATTTTLCQLHHASFPEKMGFVLSPTSLSTPIRIRDKPFPYHPLWHASSDSNSCLLCLDKMTSQQDIFPKRASVGTLKQAPPFSHHQTTPFQTSDLWPTSPVLARYKQVVPKPCVHAQLPSESITSLAFMHLPLPLCLSDFVAYSGFCLTLAA